MDTSDFTVYPMVANTDYSPTSEFLSYPDSFDKAYLGDLYTKTPDHSLDTFVDCDSFFDRPVASVEYPAYNGTTSSNTSSSTNPNSYRAAFNPAPFGQLEQGFGTNYPFELSSSFEPSLPLARSTHPANIQPMRL
jgi:hypothetical protein